MIKVLQPGLFTTVQDLGRFGYRNYGVPVSGAMDTISANIANALLNNNKHDAVLEATLMGPSLAFKAATSIVITGAEMSPTLNGISIFNYKVYSLKIGDILKFGKLKTGTRAYLAVKGGFQTETILGSKSFYDGITSTAMVSKNDELPFDIDVSSSVNKKGLINTKKPFFDCNNLKVYAGPEFDLFQTEDQKKLLAGLYTISTRINRMGYRLEEEVLPHKKSIITGPVMPGTVQLMPSGQLIVLMKDAQTTGGYPRVFQLTEKSVSILAQKKSGDQFTFEMIDY